MPRSTANETSVQIETLQFEAEQTRRLPTTGEAASLVAGNTPRFEIIKDKRMTALGGGAITVASSL